jgi:antirestriction protein ArdC
MNKKILNSINESVINALESGENPWRKTWKNITDHGMPHNLKSGRMYSGANVLLLGMQGAPCNAWVTYKQAMELGGNVRKGAKSSVVYFWQFLEKEEDGVTRKIPMVRVYRVFNAIRDCEGLADRVSTDLPERESRPSDALASYIAREQISLSHGTNQPCYVPSIDQIQMPHEEAFQTSGHYQGVLAHEAIHSTGHKSRLDRLTDRAAFGGESYAFEELVAELGACYVCGQIGVEPDFNNSAAYLRSWLNAIRENDSWLVSAGGRAQKAADYILAG